MHTPGATPFLLISPTPLSPLGPCSKSLHTLPKHRADRHFRPSQSEHKHKYFAPPLSRRSFHHPEPNTAHTTRVLYISLSAHHYPYYSTRPLPHYHITTTRRLVPWLPSIYPSIQSSRQLYQTLTHPHQLTQPHNGRYPLQRHHDPPEPSSMPRPTTNRPSASHPHKEELSIVNRSLPCSVLD